MKTLAVVVLWIIWGGTFLILCFILVYQFGVGVAYALSLDPRLAISTLCIVAAWIVGLWLKRMDGGIRFLISFSLFMLGSWLTMFRSEPGDWVLWLSGIVPAGILMIMNCVAFRILMSDRFFRSALGLTDDCPRRIEKTEDKKSGRVESWEEPRPKD